jgi:transposase InsO family protein
MPFTELCRQYGISRKTGYKYLKRFKQTGIEGLAEQSRRPLSSPLEITAEMSLAVIQQRQAHPSWGPRKLHRLLLRLHPEDAPAPRTISRVLERAGLKRLRRKKRAVPTMIIKRPVPIVEQPNDLWTIDFKGWWRTRDGARCEPLTVRDAFSRFLLDIRLMTNTTGEAVQLVVDRLFEKYGVPKAIQSDNGPPFASVTALAGLSKLSAWWMSRGIEIVRSRPGCPQDNGGHERMHADVRREIQRASAPTLETQQLICDEWRAEFNHVRPHEALDMKTPAEVYRASPRRAIEIVGGFPDDCRPCSVDKRGWMRVDGQAIYVTTSLAGRIVGVQHQGSTLFVWFYYLLLGSLVFGEDQSVRPWNPQTAAKADGSDAGATSSPNDNAPPEAEERVDSDPSASKQDT